MTDESFLDDAVARMRRGERVTIVEPREYRRTALIKLLYPMLTPPLFGYQSGGHEWISESPDGGRIEFREREKGYSDV